MPATPRPKLILLDADGVLWRGGEVVAEAPGFIRRAQAAGIRCVLISNNAGPDRAAYAAKCAKLGLDLAEGDTFSTNYLAGPYMARCHPGASVLVVGSEALVRSVASCCGEVTDAHGWLEERGLGGHLGAVEQLGQLDDVRFDAVLMGIDLNVSYAALSLAAVACQRGAKLVAANDDYTFPFEAGMTLPGNGSFVDLVAAVAGVPPELIERLGKPELHLLELIERETGAARSEMLLIGDRIETDIVMAQRAGIPSYLVLTGVATAEDAARLAPAIPIAATLDEVADALGM